MEAKGIVNVAGFCVAVDDVEDVDAGIEGKVDPRDVSNVVDVVNLVVIAVVVVLDVVVVVVVVVDVVVVVVVVVDVVVVTVVLVEVIIVDSDSNRLRITRLLSLRPRQGPKRYFSITQVQTPSSA